MVVRDELHRKKGVDTRQGERATLFASTPML